MATLKLSVLDQSVSLAGSSEDAAIRDTLVARRGLRAARLFALLAERAPRPADDRRQRARDPDGGDRRAHDDDPHRQRRRHAAALQRAQGRRAVPRPRGAGARPDRSRRRPRAGRRHADGARAQPERRRRRRGLSDPGARPPGLDQRRPPRRHHRASARAARARDLDPRQLRLRRAARRALRPAVRVRLFLHRRRRAPSRRSRSIAGSTSRASAIPSRRRRCASGRSPPRPTTRRSISRSSRDRWRIDRGRGVLGPLQSPAAIAARGFDAGRRAGPRGDARARLRRLGADGRRADRAAGRRVRARRGRDQHLGPRPGGAAHLVRAARRGASASRRSPRRT